MLASVAYWLSAFSSCSTIYCRNDVAFLQDIIEANPEKVFVFSESPWMFLQNTHPYDCAILLLGHLHDYEEAKSIVSNTKFKTDVLAITPSAKENWNITQSNFKLKVLQYKNNSVQGKLMSQ